MRGLPSGDFVREVRVMIVEDHPLVRVGLKLTLEKTPEFKVIADTGDGESAIEKVKQLSPDLVLMDINLSGMDGIACTAEIKTIAPKTRIIMLTSCDDSSSILSSLGSGANGYCFKDIEQGPLVEAVRCVMDGGCWLEPRVAQRVLHSNSKELDSAGSGNVRSSLSLVQRELLQLLAKGLTEEEIAARLSMEVGQVKNVVRAILETLFNKSELQQPANHYRDQAYAEKSLSSQVDSGRTRALVPGAIFSNRYEIISLIGQGGMGRVYKARHIHMDRIVALKILLPEVAENPRSLRLFREEAIAASALDHPSVIRIHDFEILDDLAYLVMDFEEGDDLDDVLAAKKRLSLSEFYGIFDQILDGIAAAHEVNIVHCDLKPGNVLLAQKPGGKMQAKIVDFGVAKILPPANGGTQAQITDTFFVVGSPQYMSPEQCSGGRVDHRTDIYSIGCMMYECLTGYPPFTATSPIALFAKHLSEKPRSFSEVSPELAISDRLERVVLKAIEKTPANRWQSASSFRSALSAVSKLPV